MTNPIHKQADQKQSLGENTDVPIAVLELAADGQFTYLYFNHALKRLVLSGNQEEVTDMESGFNAFLLQLMRRCQGQTAPVSADFTFANTIYTIRMRWLAKQKKNAFIFSAAKHGE